MKSIRVLSVCVLALAACSAMSQSWANAYEAGLKAARALKWSDARQAFLQAAAIRPEDASAPTTLPGPITDRRQWRNGSPYSPNFLAAYSAFRNANTVRDAQAQTAILHTVAAELQMLIDKSQTSAATLYYLNAAYSRLGDVQKSQTLIAKANQPWFKMDWHVDMEVLDPGEIAQIDALVAASQQAQQTIVATKPAVTKPGKAQQPVATTTPTIQAGSQPGSSELPSGAAIITATILGPVPQSSTKFALVIGNSASRIAEGQLPFASDDAQRMRAALVNDAGYFDSNVDLILNATSQQIITSARALAQRVGQDGTVFIYFSGLGTDIDGKDYLLGAEAESINGPIGLVSKQDLYRLFMAKGAHIFAFYEADRPIVNGRFFGMEIPLVGSIAQTQATLPGEKVSSFTRNSKEVGVYTDAFASVLGELRSGKVPIDEFGWQVFYRIRRGDTGTTGGGSRQTPTLPVLTNMAADARF